MRDGAQEAVGIGWKVDSGKLWLEVEDGTDEARVLVRETVVLLPSPSRGLDIVERPNVFAPGGFVSL